MNRQEKIPRAAEAYLHRLARLAAVRGVRDREDLLRELETDLRERLRHLEDPEHDPSGVQQILASLGSPREIVEEAREQEEQGEIPLRDRAVVPLVLFGGLLAGIGWVVGVYLLWTSRSWERRDKWLGTLLLPGGLLSPVVLGALAPSSSSCSARYAPSGTLRSSVCTVSGIHLSAAFGVPLLVLTLLIPIATAIHLHRQRLSFEG